MLESDGDTNCSHISPTRRRRSRALRIRHSNGSESIICDGLIKLQLDYTSCSNSASDTEDAEQSECEAERQQSEANVMHAVLARVKATHATLCRQRAVSVKDIVFSQLKICNFDNSFN